MKIKSSNDYVFTRITGQEPEAYAVTIAALDGENETIDCGTVARRPGSTNVWDIDHGKGAAYVSDMPKELEAATAEEMQSEYAARYKVALVSTGSATAVGETVSAYERLLSGAFRVAVANDDETAFFVAVLHTAGEFMSLQKDPEGDEGRLQKVLEIIKSQIARSREKREFRDLVEETLSEARQAVEEAMADIDDGGHLPCTPPTMQ